MAEALVLFKDAAAPLPLTIVAKWFDIKAFGTTNKTEQASQHFRPAACNLKLDDEYDEAIVAEFKPSANVCSRGPHHNRKSAAIGLLVGRNVTLSGLQRRLRLLSCDSWHRREKQGCHA